MLPKPDVNMRKCYVVKEWERDKAIKGTKYADSMLNSLFLLHSRSSLAVVSHRGVLSPGAEFEVYLAFLPSENRVWVIFFFSAD